jgi:cytochrome c-type biogenesis protein CcmE
MKPKHQRLIFVAVSVVFLCIAAIFTLKAFRNNIVYFYSTTEVHSRNPARDKLLRTGGIIKNGTLMRMGKEHVNFTLTDGKTDLSVVYNGMLPGLFRDGQGVVAEGYLLTPDIFEATTVLTKHDEKYMPKEVVDELKRQGRWREGEE